MQDSGRSTIMPFKSGVTHFVLQIPSTIILNTDNPNIYVVLSIDELHSLP
jgi:hypothetical protein